MASRKELAVCRSDDFGGYACEIAVGGPTRLIQQQRRKRGARFANFQAELAGELIAEIGRAHFGDGESAGGDDESRRGEFFVGGVHDKFSGVRDFGR